MEQVLNEIKITTSEALEEEKRKRLEIEEHAKDELARSRLDVTAAEDRGKRAGLANKEAALKDLEVKLNVRSLATNQSRHSSHNNQAKWSEELRKAEQAKRQLRSELEESLKVERLNSEVCDVTQGSHAHNDIEIPSVLVRNSGPRGRMLGD
jgi:hypothetical protein